MKVKSFIEQVKEELAHIEYCCYCAQPKGDKWHCCQENHFVPFTDLYEEDQQAILEEELAAYEGTDK
jgi:hypothetical protein